MLYVPIGDLTSYTTPDVYGNGQDASNLGARMLRIYVDKDAYTSLQNALLVATPGCELYDFSSAFILDFALLTTDSVLSSTTVSLGYAFSALSLPDGFPSFQVEGIPNSIDIVGGVRLLSAAIPEANTFAFLLGSVAMVPVILFIRRKRTQT